MTGTEDLHDRRALLLQMRPNEDGTGECQADLIFGMIQITFVSRSGRDKAKKLTISGRDLEL